MGIADAGSGIIVGPCRRFAAARARADLFSSVLFAQYFAISEPDRALGFNIMGAMIGGILENMSLLVGFQGLTLVAGGLYFLALISTPAKACGSD
jgi:hypothetical protein